MLFMEQANAALANAGTAEGFCANTANVWQLVGVFLLIFKIVIPIILIVLGMIDLGKAVVSSDDKAISKSAKTLGMRIIAAVLIFFIPTIISFVFSLIGAFSDMEQDYDVCKACITHPNAAAKDPTDNTAGTCKYYVDKL